MSLCAAVQSGASRQKLLAADAASFDRFRSARWRSAGRRSWSARRVVGAAGFDQGSAYVFVRSGDESGASSRNSWPSDAASDDAFGDSVAISGETVVVGAHLDDGAAGFDQGSAYVFVRSGAVWSQQQKLLAADAAAGDVFGCSVAISGETVVVGAWCVMARARARLGLCLYAQRWSLEPAAEAGGLRDAASFDTFGSSVAISGETVVVGARGDDGAAGVDQGSAYVFVAAPDPADDHAQSSNLALAAQSQIPGREH